MEGVRKRNGGDNGGVIPKFENTFSSFVSELTRVRAQVTELKREKESLLKTISEKEAGHVRLENSGLKDKEKVWIREKKDLASQLSEKEEGHKLEVSAFKDKERVWIRETEELTTQIRQTNKELEGSRSEARKLEGRVTSLEDQLQKERSQSHRLMRTRTKIQLAKEDLEKTAQEVKGSVDRFKKRVEILEKLLEEEEEGGTGDAGSESVARNEVGDGGGATARADSEETPAASKSKEGTDVNEAGRGSDEEFCGGGEADEDVLKMSGESVDANGLSSASQGNDGEPSYDNEDAEQESNSGADESNSECPSDNEDNSKSRLICQLTKCPECQAVFMDFRSIPLHQKKSEKLLEEEEEGESMDVPSTREGPEARTEVRDGGAAAPDGDEDADVMMQSGESSSVNLNGTTSVRSSTCGISQDEVDVLTPPQQASNQTSGKSSGAVCKRNRDCDDVDVDVVALTESAKKARTEFEPPPEHVPSIVTELFILLKCPDCNGFFRDFRSILLHRKDSESCSVHYDPSKSIRVEVLAPPTTADEAACPTVAAVINLPQTIFVCEDCDLALYSSLDVARHRDLHGEFRCDFCNFKCTYAPDLAYHELQHSRIPNKRTEYNRATESSTSKVSCAQCHRIFPGQSAKEYVHHYVDKHLDLILNEPICPICKTTAGNLSERDLLEHLKTHHDLSKFSGPRRNLQCGRSHGNCDAYFSTTTQLTEHIKVQHLSSASLFNWRDCECEDCDEIFINRQYLKEHRMVHATTPGLFPCPVDGCPSPALMTCTELRDHILAKDNHFHNVSLNVSGTIKLKCPDCELLFWDAKELLLHRKESNSCEGVYDPTTSIQVVLLVTPRKEKNVAELLVKVMYAVIILPQELYVCEDSDCGLSVYTSAELEAHKKLHGIFHCQFCDTQRTYAPDIALHELHHHSARDDDVDESGSRVAIKCPRCLKNCIRVGERGNFDYLEHHLETHLSLSYKREVKCPICKSFNTNSAYSLAKHFRHEHNIYH